MEIESIFDNRAEVEKAIRDSMTDVSGEGFYDITKISDESHQEGDE